MRRVPVAPLMGAVGAQLIGVHTRALYGEVDVQERALKALAERFEPDIVFPVMDLVAEAEAVGCDITYADGFRPMVTRGIVKTTEEVKTLRVPNPLRDGRLPVFVEVVRRLGTLGMSRAGYVSGPFTLAGELGDLTHVVECVLLEPDFVRALLDFCVGAIVSYARALLEAGAEFILMLEPSAILLSPQQFGEFSAPFVRAVAEELRPAPVILHICGRASALVEQALATEVAGLSLDKDVDLPEVAEKAPQKFLLGNLDPVGLIKLGTPEEVERTAYSLIEAMRGHPKFILSSGCEIPPDTPLRNIEALFKAAAI